MLNILDMRSLRHQTSILLLILDSINSQKCRRSWFNQYNEPCHYSTNYWRSTKHLLNVSTQTRSSSNPQSWPITSSITLKFVGCPLHPYPVWHPSRSQSWFCVRTAALLPPPTEESYSASVLVIFYNHWVYSSGPLHHPLIHRMHFGQWATYIAVMLRDLYLYSVVPWFPYIHSHSVFTFYSESSIEWAVQSLRKGWSGSYMLWLYHFVWLDQWLFFLQGVSMQQERVRYVPPSPILWIVTLRNAREEGMRLCSLSCFTICPPS